jgi:serine/threonine-protein kinase
MGKVYLAHHVLLRDRVAIKILPHALGSNPDYLKRFFREGRAARAIHHPNSVTVHELRTTADGLAYMVLEYIDGRNLREELARRGAMTVSAALELLAPIASALDEAHAHGVIHRDLKPDNMMLGTAHGKPVVKLMDLGIAKIRRTLDSTQAEPTAITVDGGIIGTPHYMSPEQWGELPGDGGTEIDGRADVYSFAVMFFELVAGSRPFEGRSFSEIRWAHLDQPVPRLDVLKPGVPPAVGEALARAMAKDRTARQATCGQLVRDLAAANPGEPDPGEAPTGETLTASAPRVARTGAAGPTAPTAVVADSTSSTRTAEPCIAPRGQRIGAIKLVLASAAALAVLLGAWGAFRLWGADGARAPELDSAGAPPPIAAQPDRSFSYTVTVQKYKNGVRYKVPLDVTSGFPFTSEDKIWVTVACDQAGYLYAIGEASTPDAATGEPVLRVLFPDPAVDGGSPRVATGATVRIPPEGLPPIDFDDRRGTEKLWLVWSAEPVATLEGAASLLNERDRGRIGGADRLRAVRELLASPRAESRTDESKRTTVRGREPALVALRELEHY